MKKFVLSIFALVFVLFTLSACGNSDKNSDATNENDTKIENDSKKENMSKFEGTWLIVKAEGSMADLNEGTKYIFEGNNLTIEKGFANNFTFVDNGSSIVYKLDGNDSEFEAMYEFKDDQLVLNPKNSDQFFYMDKQ
ncbi:MAG: hypothetical protein JXL97_02335 [Bacteroidales bacterium]|nr:hypothetical protein [Bacteroidales bacterium]